MTNCKGCPFLGKIERGFINKGYYHEELIPDCYFNFRPMGEKR